MQWLPKDSTGPIKFKSEGSVQTVMATVFWDSERIIFIDFLKGSKTITKIYYEGVLRKFKAAVFKKGRKSCTGASCSIMTMHLLTLQELQGCLKRIWLENLTTPTYSPDLAPCDFFLFHKLKKHIKKTQFLTIDDAKKTTLTWF